MYSTVRVYILRRTLPPEIQLNVVIISVILFTVNTNMTSIICSD